MNLKQAALASVAALGMVSVPVKANAQFDSRTIETIAAIFLAEKLGINSNDILSAALASNASVFDMAPAFQMQRYAPNYSAQNIYQMRQSGLGWGQVAQRINMQPGRFNQLRVSGALDPNVYWRNTYQNRFSLNQSQVNRLREMGFNWRDITNTTIIAREAGVSIFEVADMYRRYGNWDLVARNYRVVGSNVTNRLNTWRTTRTMPTQWRTVVVRPRTTVSSSTSWRAQPVKTRYVTTKSKGSAKVKAKSHHSSKGKSKGKGHAKGRGKH